MSKSIKYILVAILFFFSFLSLTLISTVYAQTRYENVVLSRGDTINRDYLAAGQTITISGTVNGDTYVAGGSILVDGNLNGDLLAAGGNITINGRVNGSVRVVGGNINISGEVTRNLSVAGGAINVSKGAIINGSMAGAGGTIEVYSPIGKEMNVACGQLTIASTVGGDVQASAGQIVLSPGTSINGNLTYYSNNQVTVQPEATVSGNITHNLLPNYSKESENVRNAFTGLATFWKIISFLTSLILGLFILRVIPRFSSRVADLMINKTLSSLGIGFIALLLTPIICLVLLATLVGIPISIILFILYLITLYLVKIFISLAVGKWILSLFNQDRGIYLSFILGLVVYYLVTSVPVLGWFITLVVIMIGLGALLVYTFNFYKQLGNQKY